MVSVGKRPLLVWVVYALGVLAGAVFLLSALVTAALYFTSDDVYLNVSTPALVIWSGLIVAAAATWLWRRRRVRG